MNIREFQDDLNNGMSISDACCKHKVSFKRAFEILHFKDTNQDKRKRPTPRRPLGNCGEAYIRYDEKSGTYMLRKKVNKKFTYFGRYKTLEDAVLVRDYMMTYGWRKNRLKSIRKELGV